MPFYMRNAEIANSIFKRNLFVLKWHGHDIGQKLFFRF